MYLPTLRRVRRISSAQRTDAVSGTDFTFDDLRSFAGIPPQWDNYGTPLKSRGRTRSYIDLGRLIREGN